MTSLTLISTSALCLAMLACSTAADAPASAMGGSSSSSGGAGNSAGSVATASGGTGGITGGTGGMVSTGGTGGTSASGGDGGGIGGTGGAGGAGGANTAGTAGGPASGGAGGSSTVGTTLVGAWDGALLEYPCAKASTSGYDCANVDCSGAPSTTTHTKSWTIGGTAGTVYNVTFRVRGVVEVTYYLNTKRDADVANGNMNTSIATSGDLFARGGTPQTSSGQSYDYNTYELSVSPAVAGAENTYFLNSVDQNENPHASNTTTHLTFKIDYTKTIKVTGGGTVTLKSFDSNCALVMNCATSAQNQCASHYSVDLSGAMPPAPTSFMQPYSQNNGFGQWVYFDITGVAVAQ